MKNNQCHSGRAIKHAGLLMVLLLAPVFTAGAQDPFMQYPDIQGNTIVFASGGDLWKVAAEGGTACRLTFSDGRESMPEISPDGSLIAFTGEYDGNTDVYVMNIDGGNITRLTWHPGADEVVGWNAAKNKIMFTSGRNSPSRYVKMYLVSPDGTGLEEMIMYDAARGSFSPDGMKIAYNKDSQDNATWKRYRGGRAQEVYIYDLETNKETNISNYEGSDRWPMWIGNKIYFSSDRDRVLNIWSYDTGSGKIEQVTRHTEYDVRHPDYGGNQIVYELGGDIWKLDLTTGVSARVPVKILTDMEERRPYMKDVSRNITGVNISPSGKRALVVARGDIFTLPEKEGPVRNLTASSGARDKDAVWSPDGSRIAFFSDASGEYELYVMKPDGKEEPLKLTSLGAGYRHTLKWSPDSKKIAWTDQTLTLWYIDVATKAITKVDKEEYENVDVSLDLKSIFDYSWSPDSRYIVYSKMNEDYMYQLYVYGLETKSINGISNGLFHDFNPVFTNDGEYILFISNRRFSPTYCDLEWEMVYQKVAGVYAVTLRKDGKSLMPWRSDEEPVSSTVAPVSTGTVDAGKGQAGRSAGKTAVAAAPASPLMVKIDFDGITDRVEALPVAKGNYRNLAVNDRSIFWLNSDEGNFNRFEVSGHGPMNLFSWSLKSGKSSQIAEGIDDYRLSADGSTIVLRKDGGVSLMPADGGNPSPLRLTDLKVWYDPVSEWKQIFNEAWRMERDYYYEPGMHGQDWPALKLKYEKLADRATCRQDLTFIIGEMIAELNTSHTYVYGGDAKRRSEPVNTGMLGADYSVDKQNNLYRFSKIFREKDWSREAWPPLAKPGVNITEGDYLLKVNNNEVKADREVYSYFVGLAGKQVTLTVNSKPTLTGAREVTVVPSDSETRFRYMDWLESNRMTVDKASGGKIGYIYLPDTWNGSATDFPRYFYSQTKKEGLIIDGRFNGGGLDPEIFLQRLQKKPHGYWTRRQSADQPIPHLAVNAHMALITNRYAGSGGDELPYEFRWFGMGPVIGTRTWGGLVGVSQFIELIDGGSITAPDYRIYNEKGEWVVENEGVTPDIIIDIDSKKYSEGYDTQLMKAVEVVMKKISEEPRSFPQHKPYPVDR
ncbi:MAG TPA: PDZ domain-containing protein [Bacteroidales bacterium]|jgi:tricorn protease|nr:PDZ domain-containing protein [Bacteroidales bacterium]HOH15233.1 PDZ domain-containing protein [Bacteroidales bacterium]HPX54384.1 PDZ domain-containing protein [Bacteroidales bacterium]HQB53480.1 PDZ domain-containing protein [Bacteroidales bacterium]